MDESRSLLQEELELDVYQGSAPTSSRPGMLKVPVGFTAQRDRLLRDVARRCANCGIVIVSAPAGFGKTALLLQYAAVVRADPSRGYAQVFSATGMNVHELLEKIDELEENAPLVCKPLIAIDDIPAVTGFEVECVVDKLLELRDEGFECLITCLPTNRQFLKRFAEASHISARMMLVQPKEYAEWARVFSIAASLDVYHLTQGVPVLVALLRNAEGPDGEIKAFDDAIVRLYTEALQSLHESRDTLYRMVALMVMLGSGSLADMERCGVKVRADTVTRLTRHWPIFGMALQSEGFRCLCVGTDAHVTLQQKIARENPGIATHAARILVKAERFDEAVTLSESVLEYPDICTLVAQKPCGFVLHGHAAFIMAAFRESEGSGREQCEVGMILAVHLAALTQGDYRLARASALELRRRAAEIETDIDALDWDCAQAVHELWSTCRGIELPNMPERYKPQKASAAAELLRACGRGYRELIGGGGHVDWSDAKDCAQKLVMRDAVSIPYIVYKTCRVLDEALHGALGIEKHYTDELEPFRAVLTARKLEPVAVKVRMAQAIAHLMRMEPISDELAFSDAETFGIRESDLVTQLFALAAEGWSALALNQIVNAQFRGQQLVKLSMEENVFLRSWGHLLEVCAGLRNESAIKIRDDADLLDISHAADTACGAWCTALHLSAARFDSELSAWYSLNRDMLLDSWFAPLARQALGVLPERGASMRRLIPREKSGLYKGGREEEDRGESFYPSALPRADEFAQLNIDLLGGFSARKNGHTLTEEIWRRKRTSVLAARLTLGMGSFVDRKTLSEELWPDLDYGKSRKCLYTTLSALRSALGQTKTGPQYILIQADGIALNREYIASDIWRFESLAREVLLSGSAHSLEEIVEDCLKIEQVFRGPLFVPNLGDPSYFVKMRQAYLSKFVDCMTHGVDAALELENTTAALWLVEAVLKYASTREDVIRSAMKTFDLCGRRREVVELYNSHLHYLEKELACAPESETRLAYESIINRTKRMAML